MDSQVQRPAIDDAVNGHIAVGRYLLHIGDRCGAVVRETSTAGRPRTRARPTPVLLRPTLSRGLLGRQTELAAALSAFDAGLPINVSGQGGIGKTAFLHHLAHHPRAASFADGIVYLSARHQSSADLLQLIFEAFHESDEIHKPTEAEMRRGLQEKQALILLDDVRLSADELEQVFAVAPRSAFVVATRGRCLATDARSLALNTLTVADAVSLLEREIERAFDDGERSAAASLCAAIGGHPIRIRQAAAIILARGNSLDPWARSITPEMLITELMASLDERQRRALLALTALPDVPLQVQHVSGIAEVPDIEPSLIALVRKGLIVSSHARYRLAAGVSDRIRRTEELERWVNRAITYFTAWAERHRRNAQNLLDGSEALLRAQQCAIDTRRWGEALKLGRLLEGALVLGSRWGAWEMALDRCLAAAKSIGDRSAEARTLHELGTRAVCLGEPGTARAFLGGALKQREAMGETAAAAVSRRNLAFVLAPVSDVPRVRSTPRLDVRPPARPTASVGGLALTALLFAALGFVGFVAVAAGLGRTAPLGQSGLGRTMAGTATTPIESRPVTLYSEFEAPPADPLTPPTPTPSDTDKANILIFTHRPGSIATGAPTRLCYAVSGAVQARVEPGIGEVDPTRTLTCLRVAPVRTTTYELTAYDRDGDRVSQQLVIVVR